MAWNGNDYKKEGAKVKKEEGKDCLGSSFSPKFIGVLFAGLLVVIGGGIATWMMMTKNKDENAKRVEKVEKVEKSKKFEVVEEVNRIEKIPKPVSVENVEKVEKPEEPKPEKPTFVKRPGALQLNDGTVLTFRPPKEGETRLVQAYGHTYKCDHLGNFTDITPRKLFHTAFEGNLFALSCAGKPFIPAFLTGLDEAEVRKMLTKEYQPIGDETEEEKERLKNYDNMRNAALEYMDEGGSFDDFVTELAKYEKDQRNAHAVSLREIMTLCKEGKLEDAKSMVEASNVLMAQKGFQPVRLPPHVYKALGIEQ